MEGDVGRSKDEMQANAKQRLVSAEMHSWIFTNVQAKGLQHLRKVQVQHEEDFRAPSVVVVWFASMEANILRLSVVLVQ